MSEITFEHLYGISVNGRIIMTFQGLSQAHAISQYVDSVEAIENTFGMSEDLNIKDSILIYVGRLVYNHKGQVSLRDRKHTVLGVYTDFVEERSYEQLEMELS